MSMENILEIVDHTALKAVTSWSEIQQLCEEAIQYHTASVCIPPSFVKRAAEQYGKYLTICTVIGFPLGYNTTETKVFETENAVANGASEIDMVVNLGDVKDKKFTKITQEIAAVKKAAGNHILKVIVETCYLTEEEKICLCQCITEAEADFIKTSTGFGTSGACVEDIELFKRHIGSHVRIKAAGGIRTQEDLERFYRSGVHRIGASSAVNVEKKEATK